MSETAGTRDLSYGIEEAGAVIQGLVGAWHDFGYETPPGPGPYKLIPPLGERSADAIRAGHRAVDEIDKLTRQLSQLREQLTGELRRNADLVMGRLDAKYGPLPKDGRP